jgi:hypothetical protein
VTWGLIGLVALASPVLLPMRRPVTPPPAVEEREAVPV